MRAVHRLQVDLRVPVTVVEHHDVGRHQIQTETPGSSRDQKDVPVGAWLRELLDRALSVVELGVAIETAVLVLSVEAVIFQDIKHGGET